MRITWLGLLRAIMTLVYFFTWFSAILAPITFFVFADGTETGFKNFGEEIYNVHWTFYIVLGLSTIGYWLFLGMIHNLRKASYKITPQQFVDVEIENYFYKAGLFCVLGSLITKVPTLIYKYITTPIVKEMNPLDSSIDIHLGLSFDSIIVILAFGIFLIIISKIMNQAIKIKTENDLTI